MFVQLSVAGLVLFFAISGVFLPDDLQLRSADEILHDDQEEGQSDNPHTLQYWKRTLDSLDLTLGLSAGLGTLLTAILSYRFSQRRWRGWGQKFQRLFFWQRTPLRKDVQIILEPQERSIYSSDSKEVFQFQTAGSEQQTSSTFTMEDHFEMSEIVSASSSYEKSEIVDAKSDEETDSNVFEMSECDKIDCEEQTIVSEVEPKYKTLEARLLAVEGNLMQDITSRMKIFEQQLEEFRIKMGRNDEYTFSPLSANSEGTETTSWNSSIANDDVGLVNRPSLCNLDVAKNKIKKSLPSRRYSASKSNMLSGYCDKLCENCSDTASKESLNNIISAGDACNYSCKSSDAGSEVSSEKESDKRIATRKPLSAGRKTPVSRTRLCNREDHKSDVVVCQEAPVKLSGSASVATRKPENSTDRVTTANSNMKRTQTRSKQQIRAILQQTNDKLAQRNKSKQFKT